MRGLSDPLLSDLDLLISILSYPLIILLLLSASSAPQALFLPLRPVLARLRPSVSASGDLPDALHRSPTSLIGIRAKCGFTSILLAVHQSEESRQEELQLLTPHLGMLGTLLSILVSLGRE